MEIIKKIVRYTPIKTFLIYFIIASFLVLAFRYHLSEPAPKEVSTPAATVSFTVNPKPNVFCSEGAVWTQKCGLGVCESTQTVTCTNDSWHYEPCLGNVLTTKEVCDGLDNDCDGYIDNNLNPPRCELTFGVCNGSYYKKCSGAGGWAQCTDSDYDRWLYEPVERTCFDGYDNDCDGTTDYFDRDCVVRDSLRY
ncbi:MAG: MopE-related protein [archaeon]